jgi:hypothetical protein
MNLVVLLIIFLLFGYVLADTRLGRKVDQAAEGAAGSSKNLVDRVEARWKAMFRRCAHGLPTRDRISRSRLKPGWQDWLNVT